MNRTKFYKIETLVDVDELDYLHNSLSKFKMEYPASYYVVRQEDLMRPDLISFKIYNTVRYWWLIMLVNGVNNPLLDLEVGLTLQIPNILDIYSFYKKWAIRT